MLDTPSVETNKPLAAKPISESQDLKQSPPPRQESKQESKKEKPKKPINMSRAYTPVSVRLEDGKEADIEAIDDSDEAKSAASSPFEIKSESRESAKSFNTKILTHPAADICQITSSLSDQNFAIKITEPEVPVRAKTVHGEVTSVVGGEVRKTVFDATHSDGSGSTRKERIRENKEMRASYIAQVEKVQAALKKQAAEKQAAEEAKIAKQQAEQKTEPAQLAISSDIPTTTLTHPIPTAPIASSVDPTAVKQEVEPAQLATSSTTSTTTLAEQASIASATSSVATTETIIPLDFVLAADLNVPPFKFADPDDPNSEIILNPEFVETLEAIFPYAIYDISLSPEAVLKIRGALTANRQKRGLSIFNPQVGKDADLVLDMKCVFLHVKLDPITGEPLHGVTHVVPDENGKPKIVVNQEVLKKKIITKNQIVNFGPDSNWMDHPFALHYVNGVKYIFWGKMSVLGIKAFPLLAEKFEEIALDSEGDLTPEAIDIGIAAAQKLCHLLNEELGLGLLEPGQVAYAEEGKEINSQMRVETRHQYLKEKKEKTEKEEAEFKELDALVTASEGEGPAAEQAKAEIAARDKKSLEAITKAVRRWFRSPDFDKMQEILRAKQDTSDEDIELFADMMHRGKGLDTALKEIGAEAKGGYVGAKGVASNVLINWSQARATAKAMAQVRKIKITDMYGNVEVDEDSPIVVFETESHISPTPYCYFVTVPKCSEQDPAAIEAYIKQRIAEARNIYHQNNPKEARDTAQAVNFAIRHGNDYYCYSEDEAGNAVFLSVPKNEKNKKLKDFEKVFLALKDAKGLAVKRLILADFPSTNPLEYLEEEGPIRLKGSKDEHYVRCLRQALYVELLEAKAVAAKAKAQKAKETLKEAEKTLKASQGGLKELVGKLPKAQADAREKDPKSTEKNVLNKLQAAIAKAKEAVQQNARNVEKATLEARKTKNTAKDTESVFEQAEKDMLDQIQQDLAEERAGLPERIAQAAKKREGERAKKLTAYREKKAEEAAKAAAEAAKIEAGQPLLSDSEDDRFTVTSSSSSVAPSSTSALISTTSIDVTPPVTTTLTSTAATTPAVATSSTTLSTAAMLGASLSDMFAAPPNASGSNLTTSQTLGASMTSGVLSSTTAAEDVSSSVVTVHTSSDDPSAAAKDEQLGGGAP